MSRIRDHVKGIVKEVIGERRASGAQGRIGTVVNVNDDGSIDVSIDGSTVNCITSYTLTSGMQVLIMLTGEGTRSAVPTLPITQAQDETVPQFFSGGFMRFAVGLYIQEVGNSKVYLLDTSDWPAGVGHAIASFSPNGKRIGVFGFNGSIVSPETLYRVYDIGQNLSDTGVIDAPNQIFGLKATLVMEASRPINNNFTPVTPNPIFRPGNIWIDNNTMFWTETIFANRGLGVGEANISVSLMGVDSGNNPITIATVVIEFVGPLGPPFFVQFRRIVNFITIFNGTKNELLMQQTNPFGSGNLLARGGLFPEAATFPNLGVEIPAPSYTATEAPSQTISPGCSQVAVTSNFLSGIRGYVQTLRSKVVLYQGAVSDPSFPEDFLRILIEIGGTITESRFSNLISSDPSAFSIFCMALMSSKIKGFFLDELGHVRPVSSTDAGVTLNIETDPTKYLKVSPGTTDPSLLRLLADPFFSAISVAASVSTL